MRRGIFFNKGVMLKKHFAQSHVRIFQVGMQDFSIEPFVHIARYRQALFQKVDAALLVWTNTYPGRKHREQNPALFGGATDMRRDVAVQGPRHFRFVAKVNRDDGEIVTMGTGQTDSQKGSKFWLMNTAIVGLENNR